jgi:putative phage-type endonuclease
MTYKPIVIEVSKASDPDEWLKVRRTGIGGSDVAAICGLNPWRGSLAVWLDKKGQGTPVEQNESMEMGEFVEDNIAQLFEQRKGFKVKPAECILRHPKFPFMLASIDRWVEEEGRTGVLEVKNVGERMASEWTDDWIPEYYQLQVQHYLAITGCDFAWVAVRIGGNRQKAIRVVRDDRLIDELIEIERKFWDLVETNQPPAIDDSEDAEKVLRLVYPSSTKGKSITLESDLQDTLKKYLQARSGLRMLKTEVQGYKNLFIQALGDAENAYIPGQEKPVISYRGCVTRRLDSVRLASENPDVAARYYTESSSRRFLVKGEEEDV